MLDHDLPDNVVIDLAGQYPLVMVNRLVPGLEHAAQLVDDFEGGYKATKYLIDMGHTRIIHIVMDRHFPGADERREGYRQAHLDHDLTVDEGLIFQASISAESARRVMDQIIDQSIDFTAVFAQMDYLALGVMVSLYHHHLVVPDDVSVIGYDDYDFAASIVPPLTTIRQPMIEIGTRMARTILRALAGETIMLPRVPVELIVRESTARCKQR